MKLLNDLLHSGMLPNILIAFSRLITENAGLVAFIANSDDFTLLML